MNVAILPDEMLETIHEALSAESTTARIGRNGAAASKGN